MTRFWRRDDGQELESTLRASRPEPRGEFVDSVVERIEAKKLRYGCEFFSALFPAREPRVVVDEEGTVRTGGLAHAWLVEEVQTALGALNDHATADALLHRVGESAPAVDAEELLAEGIAAVERLAAVEPFWR